MTGFSDPSRSTCTSSSSELFDSHSTHSCSGLTRRHPTVENTPVATRLQTHRSNALRTLVPRARYFALLFHKFTPRL